MVRLLVDECLHTSLTELVHQAGHEAYHVVWLGKAAACAPSPAPSWSRSMSRSLSLRARLEQLARTPAAPRPRSATAASAPASFVLRATGRELPRSVDVARQLIAAGLPPRAAHAVLTKLASSLARPAPERPGVAVRLPDVPDPPAFAAALAALGVRAERRRPPAAVDVAAIRRKLGLSQEEFAARFGFDKRTVQNWEQGRSRPDGPTRTLLALIERDPAAVEAALSA